MSQTPLLTYYFNKVRTFEYKENTTLFGGDVYPITMPNNDRNKSVIKIINGGTPSFYTLEQLYISLSSIGGTTYQLILEGNKNDYANNSTNKILLIIPIFNNRTNTILTTDTDEIKKNKLYITQIIKNISTTTTKYNFTTDNNDSNSVDINNLLIGINKGSFYDNKTYNITNAQGTNTTSPTYDVITFDKSNIYTDEIFTDELKNNVLNKLKTGINMESFITPIDIEISNNNGNISTTVADDIYIDCSPTNNIGQPVDVYTSKNLDQLNFFKVDNFNKSGVIISIIMILILIILIVLKFAITLVPSLEAKAKITSATLNNVSSSSTTINYALGFLSLILLISLLAYAIQSNKRFL